MDYAIEERQHLDADLVRELISLVTRITDFDGMRPLSEHVWIHLKAGGDARSRHLVARTREGTVCGYAHLDATDEVFGPSAEVAVDPAHRRHGLGRQLVEGLIALAPGGRLRLWAHGEQAGAAELAASLGFSRARVLWQMRRSLFAPLPKTTLPSDVVVRPFSVGADEEAWLALNRRAFADLPDQAGWSRRDLDMRMSEPWFDAAGFLTAWRGDRLIGFHWTKVDEGPDALPHEPLGEVYVVAVDPAERGHGLGRAMTLAGLHHLRSRGLGQAMLYVDATNTRAIDLYEGLGFARWDTDVLFRR